MDEVGFLLGLGQPEHALEVIQNPQDNGELKYHLQRVDSTRQFVTVIGGICADGTALNPSIILY
ncbi:hypothetical protein L873DRAFT_197774 [Choiromyces venosus 120613-1]|uniref:Uncharacterized protein n=1 Tax=Choiromyces venosus 120613-1 TaxID=1336337 RepID=A0A3N4J2F8_9PEZI|nr:hypothetical protein L873DRAFT_197774 [Choiromyces venosus 120613-1]